MADTNFSSGVVIETPWLNDVNDFVYHGTPPGTLPSSANVSFIQSGTGAIARTVQDKARESVSVLDFGADPTGVADSTVAFINAFASGKAVYAPAGTYLLNFLNVPSNTYLFGDGANTIIKPLLPTLRCALGADSGSASSFIENITIIGVKFLGDVATLGFSEQVHLASFNGVKNMRIDRCHFVGFRGDGLYIGSGNTGGQERHNVNVTIKNCVFDGVNSDNRNGVSIIDGDTVSIDGCRFVNTTRSGMPGSIDCEPDANLFAVIKNISITNNRFTGGNEAAIALLLRSQSLITTPHSNFVITGNFIDKPTGFTFSGEIAALGASTYPYGVLFEGNTIANTQTPFIIAGARGLTLNNNTISNSALPAEFGYTVGNYDCTISNNTFYQCGEDNTLGTRALYIRDANYIVIDGNSFVDCGRANGTAGRCIEFVSGNSGSNISLRNNTFSTITRTNYVIFATGYTFDNATCEDFNNTYFVGGGNDYQANKGYYNSFPTTGTWAIGNIVYSKLPNAGTLGWVCTVAGTPGTWQIVSYRVPFKRMISRNYTITENFDASLYDIFSLNIQANPALTYNAPTGGTTGQELTIRVKNISGGVMGTITWNAAFKMTAWTNPANATSRSITFVYDGTSWIQTNVSAADVPN